MSFAPAARIAWRTAGRLWLERLSRMTTSPGARVGARNCSTQARKLAPLIGLVEYARRVDAIVTQGSDEGHRPPVTVREFGIEAFSPWRPTPARRHVCLGPGFVDEDEPPGVKSCLVLAPLRASPGDLGPELFGGQHAFFEAQPLGVDEAPDLHIVDFDPALGEFGDQAAQGEVAPRSLEQPVAVRAGQNRRPVPADLARRGADRPAMPLRPAHHIRRADAQHRRNCTHALAAKNRATARSRKSIE